MATPLAGKIALVAGATRGAGRGITALAAVGLAADFRPAFTTAAVEWILSHPK